MTEPNNKITLELTKTEAEILTRAIQHYSPPQTDEMISIMLYSRIKKKLEEPPRSS